MSSKIALEMLRDLAAERRDVALARLADMLGGCRTSEERLMLLERYRDEYRDRFARAAGAGMSPAELANFRTFLHRLGAAIDAQASEVSKWKTAVVAGESHLASERRRTQSFDVLIERRAQAARQKDARREQKLTDEIGARMAERAAAKL